MFTKSIVGFVDLKKISENKNIISDFYRNQMMFSFIKSKNEFT